ncbi:putative L-asparaginase [Cardiosporidium cionae]|uniref:asparaginase n=1 Tax=Cardiosporidium cionae TaxID=476202 RepID=A0ABQ7J6H4_9APIC|nr:putative L-asparaginase [Cardiosporidium cionae]|eukprot:KAF8819604.1 putative L-asparaginase [Cardiosporidium cionae]
MPPTDPVRSELTADRAPATSHKVGEAEGLSVYSKHSASCNSLSSVAEVTAIRRSRHFQEFQTIVPLFDEVEAAPNLSDAEALRPYRRLSADNIDMHGMPHLHVATSPAIPPRVSPIIASGIRPFTVPTPTSPHRADGETVSRRIHEEVESTFLPAPPPPSPVGFASTPATLPMSSQPAETEEIIPLVVERPGIREGSIRSLSEHSPLSPVDYSGQYSSRSFESLPFYRTARWRHPHVYAQKDSPTKGRDEGVHDRVLIIVTGGTICMAYKGIEKSLKPLKFVEFMHSLPEMKEENFPLYDILEWEELLDSSDIGTEQWKAIAFQIKEKYNDYCGFVILHGTDTMAYTASALSFILENLTKPVVLTGSMLPIRDVSTDARRNLIVALLVAKIPCIMEVVMVFGSRIMRGNRVSKFDCSQLEAFDSPNYPYLGRVGVQLTINDSLLLLPPTNPFHVETALCPNIMVFLMTPCFSLTLFDEAMHASLPTGVILRVYGCGTLPNNWKLLHLLERGVKRGVNIAILTQCSKGEVKFLAYENGVALAQLGVINGKDMTVEACMAKMAYLMGKGFRGSELKELMENEICGEINME